MKKIITMLALLFTTSVCFGQNLFLASTKSNDKYVINIFDLNNQTPLVNPKALELKDQASFGSWPAHLSVDSLGNGALYIGGFPAGDDLIHLFNAQKGAASITNISPELNLDTGIQSFNPLPYDIRPGYYNGILELLGNTNRTQDIFNDNLAIYQFGQQKMNGKPHTSISSTEVAFNLPQVSGLYANLKNAFVIDSDGNHYVDYSSIFSPYGGDVVVQYLKGSQNPSTVYYLNKGQWTYYLFPYHGDLYALGITDVSSANSNGNDDSYQAALKAFIQHHQLNQKLSQNMLNRHLSTEQHSNSNDFQLQFTILKLQPNALPIDIKLNGVNQPGQFAIGQDADKNENSYVLSVDPQTGHEELLMYQGVFPESTQILDKYELDWPNAALAID